MYKLSRNCLRKLFVQTVFIWVGGFLGGSSLHDFFCYWDSSRAPDNCNRARGREANSGIIMSDQGVQEEDLGWDVLGLKTRDNKLPPNRI